MSISSSAVSVKTAFFRPRVLLFVGTVNLFGVPSVAAEVTLDPLRGLSAVFLVVEDAPLTELRDGIWAELFTEVEATLRGLPTPFLVLLDAALLEFLVDRGTASAAGEVRLGLDDDAIASTSFF